METNAFLQRLQEHYQRTNVPCRWAEPTEEAPYSSLLIRLSEIGARNIALDLELCFLPGFEEFAKEGVYILQSFAVVQQGIPADFRDTLLREIANLNMQLPVGAFGLFSETDALCFKHNTLLHRDWLSEPQSVMHIDRQNALLLHQFHVTIDRLQELQQ